MILKSILASGAALAVLAAGAITAAAEALRPLVGV